MINIDAFSTEPSEIEELSTHFNDLATYCVSKAAAMRFRLTGRIEAAMRKEQICEEIYDSLPEDLKW